MTGGRANIFGILYQLLRTVEWALTLRVQMIGAGDEESYRITAEPRGGDIDVRWPYARTVQQLKTRSTGRAWSLREVLTEVIPDLYLGVERHDAEAVRYELVLDHAQREWPVFESFIRRLALDPVPSHPAAALDDSAALPFFRDEAMTQRRLFLRICESIRKREEAKKESGLETQRKLWHLLSNFFITAAPSGAVQREALRPLIARYGFHGVEIDRKIDALIGAVARRATEGIAFTPAELLGDAGIVGIPIPPLAELRQAALQKLHRDLRRQTSFSASMSVRAATQRRPEGRLIAYVGESGQGKTWQLAQLAMERAGEEVVIFRRASQSVEEDIQHAVRQVGSDLLQWSRHLTADDVAAAVRAHSGVRDPWLTVCLDDVPVGQLEALTRLPLDEWGVRVHFTIARAHAEELPAAFLAVPVENFSPAELRRFLALQDCDSDTIPPDIRETLRLPLLASLYADVARADAQFHPRNEYPIYDRYWARLRKSGQQAIHQFDQARILTLARAFREGSEYPWSLMTLDAAGLTDEARNRLESLGWLRREEHGRASIWHDRGLNWAVAESIAADVRDSKVSIAELAVLLQKIGYPPSPRGPRLGYVLLDVLWMLSHRRWADDAQLAELLGALDRHESLGRSLYDNLHTIGPEISSAIVLRTERLPEHRPDLISAILQSLLAIHEAEPAKLHEITKTLLASSAWPRRTLAMQLAIREPAPVLLPLLWPLRMEFHARRSELSLAPANEMDGAREERLVALSAMDDAVQRAFDALRHAVRLSPQWLERNGKTLAADDPGCVAALISAIGQPEGRRIWTSLKASLFEQLGEADPGPMIDCIRLFRDAEERERIDRWVGGAGWITPAHAFSALVHLDPAAAVAQLANIDARNLATSRRWWLPWLALGQRDELATVMAARMRANPKEVPTMAECFSELEWALTRSVAEAMLDWLELHFSDEVTRTERHLWHSRAVLNSLTNSSDAGVGEGIRARAGTALEERLLATCRARAGKPHSSARELDPIGQLIRRMEGAAVCELVHDVTSADAPYDQTEWAVLCPDEATKAGLAARVSRFASESTEAARMLQSTRALAAAGGRAAVIPLIMQQGGRIVEINVPKILDEDAPLSDSLLEPLLQVLDGGDDEQRLRAVAAIGISGRTELRSRLISIARAALPGSDLRNATLLALRDLTRPSDDVPADLVTEDDWPGSGWTIVATLIRSGTEASLDLLERFLDCGPQNELRVDAYRALLLGPNERGIRIARRLWSKYKEWPSSWWQPEWFEIAAVLTDSEVREWFLEHAFVPGINQEAIAFALRHYDAEKAFRAAAAAFANGSAHAVDVLLRLDEQRAIDWLAAQLPDVRPSAVRWKIGRQLRLAKDRERVTKIIHALIATGGEAEAAGYELAGWIDDPAIPDALLREAAFHGASYRIVQAAIDALCRRQPLRAAAAILNGLRSASLLRIANGCEILAASVDPHVLDHREDPLCIWPAVDNMPLLLRRTVAAALEQQAKMVEGEARSRDRDREWL